MTAKGRRVGAYSSAILWIALNDDTTWLDDENGLPSVTLCLVADVFGRTVEQATVDLRREVARDRNARAAARQAEDYARGVLARAK